MKAVVCTRYGPPEGLRLTQVDNPAPRQDEVLIKILATTVTSGDVILRSMTGPLRFVFGLAFGLSRNKILGHEFAGEIEAKGKKVTRFRVGDQVFGSTGIKGGAYAEYIAFPEAGILAEKPANITHEEAAAIPVGGLTALLLLRKEAIGRGHRLLVYGASGSVGTYAVQLARHFGAHVTGVCSSANVDLVRSLGAGQVVDYTQEDFAKTGETYDVILDAVGKTTEASAKDALRRGGRFLSVKSSLKEKTEDLIFLKELIEAGEIRAVIDRRYPLEQIVAAHRYVETGHKKGNVVVTVAPNP
jgi:NADPH:quinone reductase-like Zn-dependent oxidoreductase